MARSNKGVVRVIGAHLLGIIAAPCAQYSSIIYILNVPILNKAIFGDVEINPGAVRAVFDGEFDAFPLGG